MAGGGVVIIGGAIVGSMTAYFLRQEGFAGRITVLERDPTYRRSSTALSAASIPSQFGCPINVRMSLYGAAFFKSLRRRFGPEADIGFCERGYLILGDPATIAPRDATLRMQAENGAAVVALTPDALAARFPWLNPDGVGIGTLGLQHEGWFDAWSLLTLVRGAARRRGVDVIHAEAAGFTTQGGRVTAVRTAAGDAIPADWVVNAAGPASGKVAGWLGIALPVSPRKRTAFHFKAPLDGSALPMLFDTSGAWMRPERQGFIGGIGPQGEDPDAEGDFEPDHALFDDVVWPALAHRVPALESLRVEGAWAGHYEINALDHNGIVGPHDEVANFIFATGFSGHGVMHAPATGRAVAELIVHGTYRSLDLGPLGFARIRAERPLAETFVY